MAISDINFTEGEEIGFIMAQNRGDIGTASAIETESVSNAGIILLEVPVTHREIISTF